MEDSYDMLYINKAIELLSAEPVGALDVIETVQKWKAQAECE